MEDVLGGFSLHILYIVKICVYKKWHNLSDVEFCFAIFSQRWKFVPHEFSPGSEWNC